MDDLVSGVWKSPRINKGESISIVRGKTFMTIDHVDRTIDPYLAAIIHRGKIVYTGLHATVADARQECERRFKELDQ